MTHYMAVDGSDSLVDLDELVLLIEDQKAKQVQADSSKSKQAVIPKEPVKAVEYFAKATPVFPEVIDLYSERVNPKPISEADEQVDKTGIIDLYSERMKRIEKLKRR